MKKEDLLEAMNEIDETYIEETESFQRKVIRFPQKGSLAICACMAIVILGAVYQTTGLHRGSQDKPVEEMAAEDTVTEKGESGVVNPIQARGIQSYLDEWGATLNIPEGAHSVEEYVICEDSSGESPDLVERRFVLDDMNYTARVEQINQNGEENVPLENISGMYYDWIVEDDVIIGGMKGKTMRYLEDGHGVDVCLWYDSEKGLLYSLSAEGTDLDGFDILAIVEMISAS